MRVLRVLRLRAAQQCRALSVGRSIPLPVSPAAASSERAASAPSLLWPLFGTDAPTFTEDHAAAAARVFRQGVTRITDQYEHTRSINELPRKRYGPRVPQPTAPQASPAVDAPAHRHAPRGVPDDVPWCEIAVVGRSNVGKSTLLNALVSPRGMAPASAATPAPVSRRPGFTQTIEFYALGTPALWQGPHPSAVIVDTPGYGYTEAGKGAGASWLRRLARYLSQRSPVDLPRVLVLLDSRVGVTEVDKDVMHALEDNRTPWAAVLTKVDEVPGAGALHVTAMRVVKRLEGFTMAYPTLCGVSARTGAGMRDVQCMIAAASKLHRRLALTGPD